ncbi:hypothetical protein QYE76_031202 [Lolium multiflorum]|uniref:Uncharacterized protein n=1 Tax=Lolium multiflorum TaxID=4521 RepID=A0AAD8QUK7_LOLMU|nr:hypothetical protein QYE76_031202 [Lolium multiflorum]
MRRANRLLAGLRMLGWPMEVDEGSLRGRQPVRMRIACRNPDKLKGVVQVFHKKQGFNIGIHVESLDGPSGSAPPRSPPQPSHPRDEDEDDDDMDDLSPSRRESEEREDRARAHEGGSPPGAGVPRGSQGLATSPGDTGRTRAQPGVPTAGQSSVLPSVEVRLEAGLDQYGSNLRSPWPTPLAVLEQARACRAEVEAPVGSGPGVGQPASPLVASSTLITADSEDFTPSGSPKDLGGAESLVSIGVLDSDEMLREASELDEATVAQSDGPGAGVPRRRRTRTVPAEPARKSARLTGPGAATPVLQRAQERTASRNLDPSAQLEAHKGRVGFPPGAEEGCLCVMRAGFYNICGFGRPGRRTQIKDFISRERLDFVGLQETIKTSFTPAELLSLDPHGRFAWKSTPAQGRSGGMLLGVNEDAFEVLEWHGGAFFIRADVLQLDTSSRWSIFVVYGPADHRRSADFLEELAAAVHACPFPLVVGGDFNLIRGSEDKNNDNIDWPRVQRFNDCIASLALREIRRTGARYTWTNRQLSPVRCILDRVLVSPKWEGLFPLSSLVAGTIIGSDHSPLVLSSGEESGKRSSRFFFQKGWLEKPDFHALVAHRWQELAREAAWCQDPIETWHRIAAGLRQFLRGWGANLGKEERDLKADILAQIRDLDGIADRAGLDDEGWALRYHLEGQLLHLSRVEEEYWRQRSRSNWLIQGDANTAFFHAFANGRRRKCAISSLVSDSGIITDERELQAHIYDFYRGLMGAQAAPSFLSLSPSIWQSIRRVSEGDNDSLMLTFSGEEMDTVLASMKTDTAPGPDGFPVFFFKEFWQLAKPLILAIANGFALGRVDIARLNMGVLSLIPKYADDTIIMLQPDDLAIANLKYILLCFENMSGLRINFHKSEVMVLGGDESEGTRIANMLNCKRGTFPFTYLGLPVSDRALLASDWGPLTNKVAKRADPWMGKLMSSAARLTLINACLSSLPLHAMAVCLLGEGVHGLFDKARSRFYWEANGTKRKYHWVRWSAMCKPKCLGGLGIVDTRLMNICLMAKWIWRLYAGEQGLWAEILRAKYLGERDLLADKHRPGSQFWNAIQKIKHVFGTGARHAIHNGRATRFWVDWWHEKGPLKDLFPGLFAIASEPLATVATLFLGNQCRLTFRRELGFGERVELANVARLVETIHLSEPQDRISWSLEPNGKFSVRSLYKSLCQDIPHKYYGIVWEIKVPLKVRIFLWQLSKRRLPSNDNIRRRKGPSNGTCALCLEVEDNNHIFFRCPLARFMWSAVRDLLGCSWNPSCFADIFRLGSFWLGVETVKRWSW